MQTETLTAPAALVNSTSELALLGGPKAISAEEGDLFHWPVITGEDEEAVLGVLRRGEMSGVDVTLQFEEEFAAWQQRKYALACNNGTAALHSAMFACGVGVGDEIICPSVTYWASGLQCFSLGATVVFADIDAETLCIDPADIEHRITPRTKAIMVVHYVGHPCDMDPILEIARRHNVKVIEDVSHAQGGRYKGRMLGTFGDAAAMSLMSGKSFAIGEGGALVTDNREIYERAMIFGHYERGGHITHEELKPFTGLPWGGYKYRMHQLSSAVGRVQLRHYNDRMAEIDRAMNYFWDGLEGVTGIRPHRVAKDSGSTMAGWYSALGHYRPEELGGLSVGRFAEALVAEGVPARGGCNLPLHQHSVFNDCDIYGHGKPTRIANSPVDVRLNQELKVSESINGLTFAVPWFKHYRPKVIDTYVAAVRKVVDGYEALLEGDTNAAATGSAGLFARSS